MPILKKKHNFHGNNFIFKTIDVLTKNFIEAVLKQAENALRISYL